MDASGITAKSGIWRASYRRTLADAIMSCREAEACDAAQHLARLSMETLARDLQRVVEEVTERLGPKLTIDSQLRHAILDSVFNSIASQAQSALQLEPIGLTPVA